MCGIVGFVNKNGTAADREILERMNRAIVHRGPDEDGFYVNEKIGIEIELTDTDDDDEAFALAKAQVEKWHTESNPLLYMNLGETIDTLAVAPKVIQVEGMHLAMDELANDIKFCNSIKDIDEYRVMVHSIGYEWALPIWETRRAEIVKIESDALIAAANGYKGDK